VNAEGRTCIVGSEEPEKLAAFSDRVLVVRRDELVAHLGGTQVTEREIVTHMTGGDKFSQER
jgi:ABC-type sugar transport system ATPase subunit